ncbi:ABC transporter ATP-binding protein [Aristaeella hokkaidonensis]|uniref:ABC transporter ATP-binding protein n=1 Tax=Aristaeella hokkaidonensis TaxID=3046382 RepID=UPI000B646CA9|nr:ABC transporter ATP-binding protein [Aristaeella hokkaidonensis]SNT93515.1 ATP-binding cassette, subfamily B [Aristaeella hokkaidonensis]
MANRDSIMTKPKDSKGAFMRLLSYLGAFKALILLVAVLCLISNVLSLWGPTLAGSAINEAAAGINKVNFEKVAYYAVRMLAVYVSSSLITILIHMIMVNVSKRVGRKMRQDVFDKLMRLPVGFFDRNQAGDIISRVSYDVDVISTCMATDVVAILTSVVTVAGALIMMVRISPVLSLVTLVTVPASIVFTAHMRKKTQPRFVKRSRSYGAMNGFVEEQLSGQKTIQAYAYEDQIDDKYEDINHQAAEAYYDADSLAATIGPTIGFINNIGLSLITLLGSVLYMNGAIGLGNISSFVLYSRKFSGPINEVANIINELFSALAAAERVFGLLDQPEELKDAEGARTLTDVEGNVALNKVSFGYDPDRTIIHDLSMRADAGKLTAIVGPTGAGKTTIINLLMRFYDVDSGSVTVDGQDVRELTRRSLRSAYAMVLQDTWVFRGTIFDNIAYGKENATMDEVVAAAKAAHIHPFIMRLPEGYQTVISEDGGNISKGQKQLLTIARAMLYTSNMLILDEATSNVDTSTEREIQRAMRKLMTGRTCFVIAHRLSTIRNADNILVVNQGDVVEQGTHDELMQARGFYYRLYRAQFE